MKAILGIKKGMTRVYDGDLSVAVTIVDIKDCVLAYTSPDGVELGLGKVRATKAMEGKYKELGYVPKFRKMFGKIDSEVKIKDILSTDTFKEGELVLVEGVSKGKGFAGVVKRYKFAGGPKTHGQSDRHRAPGSIGAGTDPGRVIKGLRMAGRMGSETVTLKNRKVVKIVDTFYMIKGAVPGNRGDLVIIKSEK